MDTVYISIEKNVEVFENYKNMWDTRGIVGIKAGSMTEGIETAINIGKSKPNICILSLLPLMT